MASPRTAVVGSLNVHTRLLTSASTPQKVRELLNEGIVVEDYLTENTDTAVLSDLTNEVLPSQLTCESASKEAFFARLETFTSLKWAGKPLELSPLECAKYGWINIETDMLKCCTCGAFLCATLQPTMDITKYNERRAELLKALCGAHEKFCFWPDSPSPARFCNLPIEDKAAILTGYINRFQELWCLDGQLPSLKYDDLKDMPLTEDSVNSLLLLVDEHLKQREEDERLSVKQGSESLPAHVVATVLAVCGWSSSPSSHHLPVINCSYCMRRVGLWGFQQIECVASEPDSTSSTPSTPVPQTSDKKDEKSGLIAVSPRRMVTRSQDNAISQTEQTEKPPSPVGSRTRSHNSHSPSPLDRPDFDSAGSAIRSKRPMTRSMGEVAPTGIEISSSPQRKVKRLRLCSFSTSEVLSSVRNVFSPLSQHKDWCPWVTLTKKQETASPENSANNQCEVIESPQPGWLEVLKVLCSMKSRSSTEGAECMSVPDKSTKVFRIFKQWHAPCSS